VVFAAATVIAAGATLIAQQKPAADADALEVIEIRPNFYVIAGDGSNIAVQLGTDGIVVVDTGTGQKAKQVIAEIRKLSTRPIRYVINTSADADHVGGNDELSCCRPVSDSNRRSQRDWRRWRPCSDSGGRKRPIENGGPGR
jgi:glyoxylase-like metal-dependent hydrolase (beta-lactamase superfamily II)